jgi:hypothetical protein
MARLESNIKESYKCPDEIRVWRRNLPLASTAVDVYRFGWQLEELIDWPAGNPKPQTLNPVP